MSQPHYTEQAPKIQELNNAFLARLHRGGVYAYWWTNPGKKSIWFMARRPEPVPTGENVYFGVHPARDTPQTNSKGKQAPLERVRSQKEYIAAVNCLFSEFDAKDFEGGKPAALAHVEGLRPAPSVLVDSGGGYHAYWLLANTYQVNSPEALEVIKDIQYRWVEFTGGDPGAKDLARVLRVPGGMNYKYDPPRPVEYIRAELDQVYHLDELAAILPPKAEPKRAPVASNGNGNHGERISRGKWAAGLLECLDPWRCDDYGNDGAWYQVGMALSELGAEGLALWETWSQGSPKNKPGECAGKWATFKPGQPGRGQITLGSLHHWAMQDNPGGVRAFIRSQQPAQDENNNHQAPELQEAPANFDGAPDTPGDGQQAPSKNGQEGVKIRRRKDPLGAEYVRFLALKGYNFRLCELDDSLWVNDERMSDPLEAEIRTLLRDSGYTKVNVAADAYLAHARKNSFHPVRDYLHSLKWDGKDHIKHLAAFIKDKHGNFPLVLRKWLIGAVARPITGGRQNRVMVFEGDQGIGKSHWARWIASPMVAYFSEAMPNPDDKDARLALATTWIWEIKELGAVTRRADREALKAWLTLESISERPPFGKHPIFKPAITSFVATVNDEGGFFNDPTGSRRYMTVAIESINWNYSTAIDPAQVWAQACHLYKMGEDWNLTREESERIRQVNAEYELVLPVYDWLSTFMEPAEGEFIRTAEIVEALKAAGVGSHNDTALTREISGWMRQSGYKGGAPRVEMDVQDKSGKVKREKRQVRGYYGVSLLKKATWPIL